MHSVVVHLPRLGLRFFGPLGLLPEPQVTNMMPHAFCRGVVLRVGLRLLCCNLPWELSVDSDQIQMHGWTRKGHGTGCRSIRPVDTHKFI